MQAAAPQNLDYANVQLYPSVTYHNVHVGYNLNKTTNLAVGVDNVANKVPPYGLAGNTEGGGIYEARGRFYYATVTAKLR